MRVNIYAEEMTDRLEIINKNIDGHDFTGLRFYLELPATVGGKQYQGPFMHRPGDDDSGAVTFWGKRDLRKLLKKALSMLDEHYGQSPSPDTEAVKEKLVEALKVVHQCLENDERVHWCCRQNIKEALRLAGGGR